MDIEGWIISLASGILYMLPTIIAWRRRHPALFAIGVLNLGLGWTVIGWIWALVRGLGRIEPPPVVRMSDGPSEPGPEYRYVDLVARLLELPPADRVLGLRTVGGRGIRLVRSFERPLTLRLDGPWTDYEKTTAGGLMRAAADSRPDLARLLDPTDPSRGVVFTSENQFSVSDLIHRLVTQALKVNPLGLAVERDYEDHDARPEIVATLHRQGSAEILHEESGVRVRVAHDGASGFTLRVPTASLDPGRGQRHRARQAIEDAGWRLYDGDRGPRPYFDDSDDPAACWGYSVYAGDANAAADAALRLLCTIADAPIDTRVNIRSRPPA